jgi:TnpA family transposase
MPGYFHLVRLHRMAVGPFSSYFGDRTLEGGLAVHWGEGTTSSSDGQRFRTSGGGAETSGGQAIPNSRAVADEMITAITICDRQS